MGSEIIEKVAVKTAAGRLWFGFPHWIVLGWAVLVSWQVWQLRYDMDGMMVTRNDMLDQNARNLTALTDAVMELQKSTRFLREDAIRTRTILEMKFPVTAEKVDAAIHGEE